MDGPPANAHPNFGNILVCGNDLLPRPGQWFLKTPDLSSAADAFSTNYDRVRALILQVPYLAHLSAFDETLTRLAAQEAFGTPDASQDEIEASPNRGVFLYHYKKFSDERQVPGSDDEGVDEYARRVLSDGMRRVDRFHATSGTPLIDHGLRAVISSAVILSWSAIETMFGDLWEKAVNVCPNPLAFPVSSVSNDGDVRISLKVVRRLWEGDVKSIGDNIGTILREQNEIGFASLERAREAYRSTFPDKPATRSVMKAIEDESLDALSSVRNLLVHRGGKADSEYARRVGKLKELPSAQSGEMIPLDGEKARALVLPAVECGKDLIRAVDTWINLCRKPKQ